MSATPRVSQRKPLSCIECSRRKLRCSKTIPCTSCIDRGLQATCSREKVIVKKRNQRLSPGSVISSSDDPEVSARSPELSGGAITVESLLDPPGPLGHVFGSQHPSVGVPDDAPVTLENLALGRQRILNMQSPANSVGTTVDSAQTFGFFEPVVSSVEQARILLDYHYAHLGFIHNVLHMPTFMNECEAAFRDQTTKSRGWNALYLAFLCHTIYHGPESIAISAGLSPQRVAVETLYQRTLQALQDANFMAVHSLEAAQAVCLIIQVAHNLGYTDYVFVVLSCTNRIAQSLDINRLGADSRAPIGDPILREVKKRVWWFLIKQDWMQIPYGNMFTINALHFNTPPPLNCFEDPHLMVNNGYIRVQDSSVPTQSSWSSFHNQVAILLYRTQDKMCRAGHPGNDPNGVRNLYNEVLAANAELQRLWNNRPDYLKAEVPLRPEWPDSIPHMRRALIISFARAYFSIHRHFQLRSFRDDNFAVTRSACLSAARSSLRTFIDWPDDDEALIWKKMWTNNNNVVAAAVALLFGLLFSAEKSESIFEKMEMRQLLTDSLPCFRKICPYSSVARRGLELVQYILEYERGSSEGTRSKLDIDEVIGHVRSSGVVSKDLSYSDWSPSNADQFDLAANTEEWYSYQDFGSIG